MDKAGTLQSLLAALGAAAAAGDAKAAWTLRLLRQSLHLASDNRAGFRRLCCTSCLLMKRAYFAQYGRSRYLSVQRLIQLLSVAPV